MRWLVVAAALVACGKDSDHREARNVPADPTAPPAVVHVDAAVPAPANDAHAWFERYRTAHADATPANAIETGKVLWELLATDAQKLILDQAAASVANLGTTTRISSQEIAYKILGESAAVRAPMMRDAKITKDTPNPDKSRTLHVEGGGKSLDLTVVEVGGTWKMAVSPALTVDESEMFKAPSSGSDAPAGLPTFDALVARWKAVVTSGNGWDAINIMSPSMHQQFRQLIASMGGNGMADVARIMEKTLVDRRNRGVTVTGTKIDSQTADRGQFTFTYSTGATDSFTAVHLDGVWWLEMTM